MEQPEILLKLLNYNICIFASPTLITYILFEPLAIASPVPNISAIQAA